MINSSNGKPRRASPQFYFLARLEAADGREWFSLHWTDEDAERQLKAVGAAWGVGFTPDGEPADGFRRYGAEQVPVLGPEESGELGGVVRARSPTRRRCLEVADDGGAPVAVSREMADDLGIPSDVAALRLVSLTALEMAHEVSPGRYRPGSKDE